MNSASPLRILMVSMDYPPRVGGLAAHVYELSAALSQLGHRVRVLTRRKGRSAVQEAAFDATAAGAPVTRIALHLPGGLQGLTIQRAIDRQIAAEPVDLIHAHGLRALEFARRRVQPLMFTNHTSGFLRRMELGGRRVARLAKQFRVVDGLLSPSRELLEIPGDHPPPARRHYLPNGVRAQICKRDQATRRRLRSQLGLNKDESLGIVTRRLVEKNGVIHLAKAAALLRSKAVRLLFIGDGPQRAQVEAELQRGFAGRYSFLGSLTHDELLPWYSAADFAVLPSLKEATSISGLEAMAASLPLVGTRVGGIPDLIAEGETGLLVPPADSPALADAIDRLLDGSMTEMGRRAAKIARQQFDWQQLAARTAEIYHQLLAA